MIRLKIENHRTKVLCRPDVERAVSDLLSYIPPGAEHQKRYLPPHIAKNWDGRVKLLKRGYFPTGLLGLVEGLLEREEVEYQIEDLRIPPESNTVDYNFSPPDGFTERDYQEEAIGATESNVRGVTVIGTGGGKGYIMARVIANRGVQTLVCAPDVGIREQLHDDFRTWFGRDAVSKKIESASPIVVSNIGTLARRDAKYYDRFKMLITDEFHHSAAKSYIKMNALASEAYWRYGYTGTFLRADGREMTMMGVLSNIIYQKSASDLIEDGWLVPPKIKIFRWQLRGYSKYNYKDAYTALVTDPGFNRFIADLAEKQVFEGKQVLILVRRKEAGRMLAGQMGDRAVYLNGDDPVAHRKEVKRKFKEKTVRCLIATSIFGEGQDVPGIDVFINARLQEGEIETRQGIGRALRPAPGKEFAEVFDFLIVGHRHLVRHSVSRINQYKSERAFKLSIERI